MADKPFKRALFGYRRAEVDEAVESLGVALDGESRRAQAETTRADVEAARAGELEQASLDLAGRLNSLELVANRLAQRVVERERTLAELSQRVEVLTSQAVERDADEAAVDEGEAAAPSSNGAGVYDGRVELEIGPLSDFAQLAGFEDAASEIGGADGVSVKGFAQGRATLELHLTEPVELLRELEERAPFEFKVRDTRSDRVVLDVDAE